MTQRSRLQILLSRKQPDPSYPDLPLVKENGESSVPGLYLTGDAAGTPLIKLGLNEGVDVVDRIHDDVGAGAGDDPALLDLVIVGAGASGLAAAVRAHELGMRYQVLEAEEIATTVVTMYRGKVIFAEPDGVSNRSGLWFEECTREELLERWRAQVRDTGLHVREHERVVHIAKSGGGFSVTSERSAYRTRRVILALGKSGNPRRAGVPGEQEHAHKVHHTLRDPHDYRGKRILIYGGGDVAAEAALALCRTNDVTLVTVDEALTFPRKRNAQALRAEQAAGRLALHLSTELVAFDDRSATIDGPGAGRRTIPNDDVFEMIGSDLPVPFFRRIGVRLERDWHVKRWVGLVAAFVFAYSLYALKKYPETPYAWPFTWFWSEESFAGVVGGMFRVAFAPFTWMFGTEARRDIFGTLWFQQGYLYSLLYTVVFAGFGYQAFLRWTGIARDPRYQKWRYVSLTSFQAGFFLLANVVGVHALSVEHSWRVWGLSQPWPLFISWYNWWGDWIPKVIIYVFISAGILLTFVAIPWAARKHGKRFCTWICGCGGLAETLGDRWRHLAPKGARSRAWEFQGAVVLAAATLATVITVGMFNTRADNVWMASYQYLVDFWLIATIPIALYPFFGGKVWCRYWCPLAAWNQILARWYGRLRITANDKCISCTLCSRHCQVGVDVMAFAKHERPFDNRNSSCIQCGICIDVCPMDVLAFDLLPAGRLPPQMEAVGSAETA